MINQEKTLELVDRSQRKDKEKTALSYQEQGRRLFKRPMRLTQQHLPSWSPNFSQWYSGLPSGCFVTKTKPGT